jgi:hypothetical protein
MAQVVEHLSSKCKALSSNLSTIEKKKRKGRKEGRERERERERKKESYVMNDRVRFSDVELLNQHGYAEGTDIQVGC